MSTKPFALELRKLFGSEASSWILRALYQEPLVNDYLADPAAANEALETLSNSPSDWNAARLGLLALGDPIAIGNLCDPDFSALEPELHQQAKAALNACTQTAVSREAPTALSLADGCLAALALREKLEFHGNWQFLADLGADLAEIPLNTSEARLPLPILRPLAACLVGMTPEPFELIKALFELDPASGVHAFLCLPAPENQKRFDLIELTEGLPAAVRREVFKFLASQRLDLTREIDFLDISEPNLHSPALINELSWLDAQLVLDETQRAIGEAKTLAACERPAAAIWLAQQAQDLTSRWQQQIQAFMYSLIAQAYETLNETAEDEEKDYASAAIQAWEEAFRGNPSSLEYRAQYAWALLGQGNIAEAKDLIEPEAEAAFYTRSQVSGGKSTEGNVLKEIPFSLWAAAARMAAMEDHPYICQIYLRQGINQLNKNDSPEDAFTRKRILFLMDIALSFGFGEELGKLAQYLLDVSPADPRVLSLAAEAQLLVDNPEKGLALASLAFGIAPTTDQQHLLIRALEACRDWSTCLLEQQRLNEQLEIIQPEDYRHLGAFALQAGQPEICLDACEKALEINPTDGLTLKLLGELAQSEGDLHTALEYYQQAAQQSPHSTSAWLSLAALYRELGQTQNSLETLRQASQAAPGSVEISLKLGEALIREGALSAALSPLRQAAKLIKSTPGSSGTSYDESTEKRRSPKQNAALSFTIGWRLGRTLYQLGFVDESRQVFENCAPYPVAESGATRNPLAGPEFSYDYAQTLLACGDISGAIPCLEIAIQDPSNRCARLDLARTLLADSAMQTETGRAADELQQAIGLLEQILETQVEIQQCGDPLIASPLEDAEAFALLAEALQRIGDLPRALNAYRQAIQIVANTGPSTVKNSRMTEQKSNWRLRLPLGLGQVSMALGQYETAIAAFLEAVQDDSTNPFLYRCLSEAYAAVDLPGDAFQTARQALHLDPENPDTYVWYADQCLRLYEHPTGKALPAITAALDALTQAYKLAPERADLLVRLAEIHVLRGDSESALQTLNRLVENPITESEEEVLDDHGIEMVITLADLRKASDLLRRTGQPAAAAIFIQRALNLAELESSGSAQNDRAELYDILSQTYREANDLQSSLIAVNQALETTNDDEIEPKLSYLQHKASILLALQNFSEAQTTLLNASVLKPEVWEVHLQIALLHAGFGALTAALEEAQTAIQYLTQNGAASSKLALTRWIAAEIAHSLIQDERAKQFLEFSQNQCTAVENACLQAELELQSLDEQLGSESASAALVSILEIAPRHPHVLALQARLISRQEGVTDASLQLLDTAAEWIGSNEAEPASRNGALPDTVCQLAELSEPFYLTQISRFTQIAILNGLAEAALELGRWTLVEQMIRRILVLNPESPAAHLLNARALTRRAEMQRLCEKLLIVRHAPGSPALSENSRITFERDLLLAAEVIDLHQAFAVSQVSHWRARGNAVFSADADSSAAMEAYAENSPLDPEDIAALIWCAGTIGDLQAAQNWGAHLPNHSLVSAVMGVVLNAKENERARVIVQTAIDRQANPSLCLPDAHAMLIALAAIIGFQGANRGEDYQAALKKILAALEIWPDEARWHDLAALILLESAQENLSGEENSTEQEDPIFYHLEQAARLEPELAEHHQKFGRYLALQGETEAALEAFIQAVEAAPDSAEAWLELATIQKDIGLLNDAIQSVERALAFANQSVEALLLRCELALQTNNPRGALSRAQIILNIIPDQPDALYVLAQAQEALNEPGEALIAIEKGIARLDEGMHGLGGQAAEDSDSNEPDDDRGDPKLVAMQRLHVRLIYQLNGPNIAIEFVSHLEKRYIGDPIISALLADYLWEANEPEKASQAARAALQTGAFELDAEKQAHLHYLIGVHSRQSGQLDQALYHLNQSIQKSPDFIDAYLELGRTHQDRRQSAQALESYQLAARRMPNDYRPYYLAGLAMKEGKDYIGAETMFRRAAHLAPSEVSIHRQLAAVVALNLIHNRRIPASD